MLDVFPRRKARLEVKRIGIGTHRMTQGARAARVVSVPSRANTRRNRQQMAEGRRLLLPVMIFPRPWFGWRFREITGEIFLARSPRADHAGPTARKYAGRKSPDPKCQSIEFIGYFGAKNFSCFGARYRSHLSMTMSVCVMLTCTPKHGARSALLRSHLSMTMSVLVILRCALFARPEGR